MPTLKHILFVAAVGLCLQNPTAASTQAGQEKQQTGMAKPNDANNTKPKPESRPTKVDLPTAARGKPPIDNPRTDSNTKPTADWWLVYFTAALVLVAVLQFAAMLFQARYMRQGLADTKQAADAATKSATVARDSILLTHRPRIIVRNVVIPAFEGPDIAARLSAEGIGGYLHIANIGGSPATVIALEHGVYFTTHLEMRRPYDDGVRSPAVETTLAPGMTTTIEMAQRFPLDPGELAAFQSGVDTYLIVLIEYIDGLGHKRHTAACRRFNRETWRFIAVSDPDYEYAD